MSLIDISTNAPDYLYWKSIGTTNENFNFDIRDYRVKRELRVLKNTLTDAVDKKGKSQGRLQQKQSINQSIYYVNTWDEATPIIRARGSCIKRMTFTEKW